MNRNYAAKDIRFGGEARASMLKGVEELHDDVKLTKGAKVFSSFIFAFFCSLFYRKS